MTLFQRREPAQVSDPLTCLLADGDSDYALVGIIEVRLRCSVSLLTACSGSATDKVSSSSMRVGWRSDRFGTRCSTPAERVQNIKLGLFDGDGRAGRTAQLARCNV